MATKDGGWGWMVAIAAFVIHLVAAGVTYSSGVLYRYLLTHFEESPFLTAWAGALLMSLSALAAVPATLLIYLFGYRVCIIFGGFLAAAGLALASLATQIWHVYITIGVMTGLGYGFALTPSIMVLDTYFFHKREAAAGLAVLGSCFGIIFFPFIFYHLEENLAWKGLLYILSGISFNICLCGATMRQNGELPYRPTAVLHIFDCGLLKSAAFSCICVTNILWSIGVSMIYTHLPGYVLSEGLSLEHGVFLLSISGISCLTSRSIFLYFVHHAKMDHASAGLCTVGLTAVLTGVFPDLFTHWSGMIGYSIMLGVHIGFWTTFISGIATELVGAPHVARGKGFLAVSIASGLATGPPLGAFIQDHMDDFHIIFYIAGGCLLLSSIIMMAVNLTGCYYRPDTESRISYISSKTSSSIEEEHLIVSACVTAL